VPITKIRWGKSVVALKQETRYPWDGKVKVTVGPEVPGEFAIHLRIPGWCDGAKLAVDGRPVQPLDVRDGYALLRRPWRAGDTIELDLPMPVRRIEAHPRVRSDRGRVAVERGPIVYCFEGVDNGGPAKDIVLARDPELAAERRDDLLGGTTIIRGVAQDGRTVTAVPYHVWDNRAPGEMIVWVRQEGKPEAPRTDDPAWEGILYRPF
jgi:uncharacterized protein